MSDGATRIVIADSSPITRAALAQLVDGSARMTLVADTGDSATTLRTLAHTSVDVLLLAIGVAGRGCAALVQAALQAQPDLRIVVRYTTEQVDRVLESLAEGAAGCVSDTAAPDELLRAVDSVADGQTWLCQAIQAALCDRLQRPTTRTAVLPRLTIREQDVLRHAADGASTRHIAKVLHLSESTVKAHFRGAFQKLQASSRSQAVAIWLGTQSVI